MRRGRIVGAIVVVVVLGALGTQKLFARPSYEFALAAGLLCPSVVAVVTAFLPIAAANPGLPAELLPIDWPESAARALALDLMDATRERMLIHGNSLPGSP